MSGRVPPSSKANVRGSGRSQASRAATRYKRFTGQDAEYSERVKIPPLPAVVAMMGRCDALMYTAVRDGQVQKFIHKFKDKDAPAVCVTPDGKQILLVGGHYTWTERGIVDRSDKS